MKYVLYHSNCYDGFGAAFAAWKKFGNDAKYIPVSYGCPPPDMPDTEEVYIVDFSFPKDVTLSIADKVPRLVILDHHKTAEENLRDIARPGVEVVFDMNRSGALIAWEFLHPDLPVPELIKHISDRDLWKFEMEGSREVHSALVSLPFDFEIWDKLDVPTLISEGGACQRFQQSVVDKIVKAAWVGKVDSKEVPIVNTSFAWSEVGEALLEKYPEAEFAASFTVFNDQVMWSLRSRGEFDVSAIAKKYGGGGHKNAAGFKTTKI